MLALSLALAAAAGALPDVDQPLRTGASAPADAAVIVGVEDYAFIGDVTHASADARAVYNTLLYTRGVPAQHLHLLDGGSREQILQQLEEAVTQVGEGGRLWFYFAGHGAASLVDGERMLLGDDVKADTSVFDARGVRLSELTSRLRGVEAVVLLDTCYAGVGRTGEAIIPGSRFAVPTAATRLEGDLAIWSAAAPNELSGPLDEAGHGLFTYLAVGALRGWADGELSGERDGQVSLDEAQAYVQRAMGSLQVTGQHPQVEGRAGPLTTGSEDGPRAWTPKAAAQPDPQREPRPERLRPARAPGEGRPHRAGLGWALTGAGVVLGAGSYLAGQSIESPTQTQVSLYTALNVAGWGVAGVAGGMTVTGLLSGDAVGCSVGGRF
ncbi:MAG: caspase family protein [Deltaproteobacteria bacterium]|nr:caspase family protein [Deltaproteobacteria bacterium]